MTAKKRVLFTNLRSLKLERGVPIHEAHRLGYEVVLMAQHPPLGLEELIEDYIIVDNPFDHSNCLKKIQAYHQRYPLSGIFTWTDRDVELVAKAGELLGLKTLSSQAARLLRNKYAMREALNKVPGLCPRFFSVKSLKDLELAMQMIKGKAVFKPVGASAIIHLDNGSDLTQAYTKMQTMTDPAQIPIYGIYKNEYLCEEYLDGPEVSVDGFVADKEIYIFGVTDKEVTEDYSIEYNSFFPSALSKAVIAEIKEKTCLGLQALELNNAPFHLEGRYTSKGFMILECAGHSGGGFIISHLIPTALGRSCIRELIKLGVGMQPDWDREDEKPDCYAGRWDNLPARKGVVSSIRGIEEALEVEGIHYALSWLKVGDQALLPPQSFSCIASTVIGTAKNSTKLKQIINQARRKIIVELI